jgi:D-glycero-D-manno-heptose 1,7-bisphosphate phosphatase
MRRAVFLDRDGVLNAAYVRNGVPHPPASVAELRVLPGVPEALAQLEAMGYLRIVVTNQPDIARGTTTQAAVDAINQALGAQAPVDEFRVCPHDGADHCACRKPRPGLLLEAAAHWGIDLSQSFMVGDRWRDIDAGHAAGVKTFFIDYGYPERQPEAPTWRVRSLAEAVSVLAQSLEQSEG